MTIKLGDVVTLNSNSNGPKMTVTYIFQREAMDHHGMNNYVSMATCYYFVGAKLEAITVPVVSLSNVKE